MDWAVIDDSPSSMGPVGTVLTWLAGVDVEVAAGCEGSGPDLAAAAGADEAEAAAVPTVGSCSLRSSRRRTTPSRRRSIRSIFFSLEGGVSLLETSFFFFHDAMRWDTYY